MDWDVVYEKAIRDDGSLWFPQRLTKEFLDQKRRVQGSYVFANQYQNEIIPDGEQDFKKEWLKYYKFLPSISYSFGFVDPAISIEEGADYTALVIVDVDPDQNWYVRLAKRQRLNPTQIVNLLFNACEQFKLKSLGIEDVAYQKALLYMTAEEMKRRGKVIPVTGVKPTPSKTKEMRIRGLVPRFEWGRISIAQGMHDFEMEYSVWPRGSHDDIMDALAYLEQLVFYPTKGGNKNEQPAINSADYEKWYIKQLLNGNGHGTPGPRIDDYEGSDGYGE